MNAKSGNLHDCFLVRSAFLNLQAWCTLLSSGWNPVMCDETSEEEYVTCCEQPFRKNLLDGSCGQLHECFRRSGCSTTCRAFDGSLHCCWGKKSRTVKSPQEIDKSDVKKEKGKKKRANCLNWHEWRKVRKKRVSPTKSPCDHFETRTKDEMGLSWFWFGVGLVCGLVPPLVFLHFLGISLRALACNQNRPLGPPAPQLYRGSHHGWILSHRCCCGASAALRWRMVLLLQHLVLGCGTWLLNLAHCWKSQRGFLTSKRKLLPLKLLVFVEAEESKKTEKGGNDVWNADVSQAMSEYFTLSLLYWPASWEDRWTCFQCCCCCFFPRKKVGTGLEKRGQRLWCFAKKVVSGQHVVWQL